jgi:hypothetical protein
MKDPATQANAAVPEFAWYGTLSPVVRDKTIPRLHHDVDSLDAPALPRRSDDDALLEKLIPLSMRVSPASASGNCAHVPLTRGGEGKLDTITFWLRLFFAVGVLGWRRLVLRQVC